MPSIRRRSADLRGQMSPRFNLKSPSRQLFSRTSREIAEETNAENRLSDDTRDLLASAAESGRVVRVPVYDEDPARDPMHNVRRTGRVWKVSYKAWTHMTTAEKSRLSSADRNRHGRSLCFLPVLRPDCAFARGWVRFITIFDMTHSAFYVPISIGFGVVSTSPLSRILFYLLTSVLVFNLFINFHIGFVVQHDSSRAVIRDGHLTARFYLKKGTLVVDALSAAICVALAVMYATVLNNVEGMGPGDVSSAVWTLYFILHALRICRMWNLIGIVKELLVNASSGGSKSMRRLRKLLPSSALYLSVIIYMLMLVVNIVACLWFWVGQEEMKMCKENWISANLGSPESSCCFEKFRWATNFWLYADRLPEGCEDIMDTEGLNFTQCYVQSIYYSLTTMTTVGYGDITPVSTWETILAIGIMILGVLLFAVILGAMQEIFIGASAGIKDSEDRRQKYAQLDQWLTNRTLPERLEKQVRSFFHDQWRNEDSVPEAESDIFYSLPLNLRKHVAEQLTSGMLSELQLFSFLEEHEIQAIARELCMVVVPAGTELCLDGDPATGFWIVQEGSVALLDANMEEMPMEPAPSVVAESAILSDVSPHFSTLHCGYRCTSKCLLWELRIESLRSIYAKLPAVQAILQHMAADMVLANADIPSRGAPARSSTRAHILNTNSGESDGSKLDVDSKTSDSPSPGFNSEILSSVPSTAGLLVALPTLDCDPGSPQAVWRRIAAKAVAARSPGPRSRWRNAALKALLYSRVSGSSTVLHKAAPQIQASILRSLTKAKLQAIQNRRQDSEKFTAWKPGQCGTIAEEPMLNKQKSLPMELTCSPSFGAPSLRLRTHSCSSKLVKVRGVGDVPLSGMMALVEAVKLQSESRTFDGAGSGDREHHAFEGTDSQTHSAADACQPDAIHAQNHAKVLQDILSTMTAMQKQITSLEDRLASD